MMPGINGDLHVVADDAGPAALVAIERLPGTPPLHIRPREVPVVHRFRHQGLSN